MSYWIYFRGTNNGEYIQAATMKAAKWIFARKYGLVRLDYVAGRKAA